MNLSMTTDYVTRLGDPSPYLRWIAAAGFTHVHWCHQWDTGYLYPAEEICTIGRWLRDLGLRLLDLHAPCGSGSGWGSAGEAERLAAVELLRNRIEMAARLGGGVVILHLPPPERSPDLARYRDALRRSLDELEPHVARHSLRIALENMVDDDFGDLDWLFSCYPPGFVGLCYDSGHGNLGPPGLDKLALLRDRLVSVHLHDNDGTGDQHCLPFSGTVDWVRLSRLIAASSYRRCVSLESVMGGRETDEAAFLERAYQVGLRLAQMIEAERERRES